MFDLIGKKSLCLIAMCLTLVSISSLKGQASSQPNILLVITDDQGWGDMGFHGNPVVHTPNLDKLAAEGTVWDRFFVNAVCSPTRASLLTGRYAVRGGVYSTSEGGERLDLDETTFASVLQHAGYQTAAFGKWHNGTQSPYHPNDRGFDTFVGYTSGHWGSYVDAWLEKNGEPFYSEGYLTDFLTHQAISFIESQQDTNWLVYLALNTPHSPMQVPDSLWERYKDLTLPEHRYQDREKPNHTRAAYAMVENIDQNVGRLVQALETLDLTKETLIIFLSDNGPNGWRWNGGMEGIKGKVDEGGLRVPMIMAGMERFSNGDRIPSITSVMDLFPTLLEICEVSLPDTLDLDGESMLPLLEGNRKEDRALVQHWRGQTSVRTQQYRLAANGALYDMNEDEAQNVDLSDSVPVMRDSLLAIARRWEEEVLGELAEKDERPFPIQGEITHLPARDGVGHGNIKRSNRWPNCSFYQDWKSSKDSITWEVEVSEDAWYEVSLYYALVEEGIGAHLKLTWDQTGTELVLNEAHESPLEGAAYDRYPRGESLVRTWAEKRFSPLFLSQGKGRISLNLIAGTVGPDVRLLVLRKVAAPK